MLADDCDLGVRQNVAGNKNAPKEALVKLAGDRDYGVRKAVVNNPNTSYNTLLMLSKVKAVEIREKAKEVLKERALKANTNKER